MRPGSVQPGRKAANSDQSGEQHLAHNASESAAWPLIQLEVHYKDGTWEYPLMVTLKFQTEHDDCRCVKFKHTLLLDADVPQLPISGPFCRQDREVDVREYLTEEGCQRTTTMRRRAKAAGVPSGSRFHSPRMDEKQIWELVDEGLKALVRHFCEEYREWKWIPDREKKAGTHRSAAATRGTHQSTGAEAGKKLLDSVYSCLLSLVLYVYAELTRL